MVTRGRGMHTGARDNADLPTGFHGRPTGPGAHVLPPRNDGLHEISRLKPEMLFVSGEVTSGEPVPVGSAPLPVASSFCRPDLYVR